MTVSSETRKAGPYQGNGVTASFPFGFKVFTASDLLVVRANAAGTESTLVLGTDYTASLNANQNANPGGTVTLAAALATGYTLVLTSQLQNLQPTDLTNQGGFYPAVINNALDRATIQIQQLAEGLGRAVQVPITGETVPGQLGAALITVSENLPTITEVAGVSEEITVVAGISADVQTVAGMAGDVHTFADVYLGAKSADPTTRNDGSPLQPGDLYFSTATSRMRVRAGESWVDSATATPVTISTQRLSGDGSITTFLLENPPSFQAACEVFIAGAAKVPGVDYTVTGSMLTFASAPPAGTNNIYVRVLSAYAVGVPADGSITAAKLADGVATADPGSTGLVVRIANKEAVARTVTAGAGITVTNGNGFAGNPTIANAGVLSVNGQTGAVTVATGSGAAAWVNFNGTGTVAIRACNNVSSITDNATGDYTVNFTTALADANYAVAGAVMRETTAAGNIHVPNTFTSTSYRFTTRDVVNTARDGAYNSVVVFR